MSRCTTAVLVLAAAGLMFAQNGSDEAFIGGRGKYWAFQKVVRPPVPAIPTSSTCWNAWFNTETSLSSGPTRRFCASVLQPCGGAVPAGRRKGR